VTTAVEPMRDRSDITVRPTWEVRCPQHGVVGHATRTDDARAVQGQHWRDQHATVPGVAT